MGQLHL